MWKVQAETPRGYFGCDGMDVEKVLCIADLQNLLWSWHIYAIGEIRNKKG